jgi:hypothetical protein
MWMWALYFWSNVFQDMCLHLKKEVVFFRNTVCYFEYICDDGKKVLVNNAEISPITIGFPLGFLSLFMQQLVLSQKHNTTACAHIFSNRPFAINLKFGSSDVRQPIHTSLFPQNPPTLDISFTFQE